MTSKHPERDVAAAFANLDTQKKKQTENTEATETEEVEDELEQARVSEAMTVAEASQS